jgi:hypothetical protein
VATLELLSAQYQRTPFDIFVYEPFDFANEYTVQCTQNLLRLTATRSFDRHIAENDARSRLPAGLIKYRKVTKSWGKRLNESGKTETGHRRREALNWINFS